MWVKWHLALHLLLLTMFQLYHLPPPVSNFSCLFTRCQPLYASCYPAVLYFSRYFTVKLKLLFLCFFLIHYFCEKYYKPITVWYYIASCVSWVPRLTLLDLWVCSWKGTHLYVGDLLCHLPERANTWKKQPMEAIDVNCVLHTPISMLLQDRILTLARESCTHIGFLSWWDPYFEMLGPLHWRSTT